MTATTAIFAWPEWAWGLAGGWRRHRPLQAAADYPDFAYRRPVWVAPGPEADFVAAKRTQSLLIRELDGLKRLPVKEPAHPRRARPGGTLDALSSGSGSAILRLGDAFVKVKRCGLYDVGFTGETLGRSITLKDASVGDPSAAGLISLASAAREIKIGQELCDVGLATAYRPLGVFVIQLGELSQHMPPGEYGACVFSIESDLRADEVLATCLTPALVRRFEAGDLRFSSKRNTFLDVDGSQPLLFNDLDELTKDVVHDLACACGAAHRLMHQSQYLRGRGSAWLGNDVVTPDGRVELVDYDGGTRKADTSSVSLAETEIELAEHLASTVAYFSWQQSLLLADVAKTFNEAFMNSYRARRAKSLHPTVIEQVAARANRLRSQMEEILGSAQQ